MKLIQLLVSLILTTITIPGSADELHLKNGSKLIGTLVSAGDGNVVFNTPFAGDISVKAGNIERIVTAEPVTMLMEDGAIYRDRRIDTTAETLVAQAEGEEPVAFATTDIQRINPEPWRLGDGYKWTGKASAAVEYQRGNTDTDEWDVSARTVWRSLKDRYTLQGELELDKADGDETSDNWETWFKYDRFSRRTPKNYYGASIRFEYDKFADLDLRTTVGPHIGRQFLDSGLLSLAGELGPVWVDERFNEAEDNDFPGALWRLGAMSDVIGFGTELYLDHDGTFNFDDPDDVILNTTIGIRMPLILGFETGFEAKYEYDGGAVEDVDTLDETYNFWIGYAW